MMMTTYTWSVVGYIVMIGLVAIIFGSHHPLRVMAFIAFASIAFIVWGRVYLARKTP